MSTKSARLVFIGRIPSLKNEKRIIRIKGRLIIVPSVAWGRYERQFKKDTSKLSEPVKPPYEITYTIHMKGKGAQDIDNIVTGANDLLQKVNYISDDKHILKITARKLLNQIEYKTVVQIKHYAIKDQIKAEKKSE